MSKVFFSLFFLCISMQNGMFSQTFTHVYYVQPYEYKNVCPPGPTRRVPEQLYISLNLENGRLLVLSDETTYEVAPDDRIYSSLWITPCPIHFDKSDNTDYPITIHNDCTITEVSAREIEFREMVKEEQEKNKSKRKPRTRRPTNEAEIIPQVPLSPQEALR